MDHFWPKYGASHNFVLAVRIFCRFCTMKKANREMKLTIMVCTKEICSVQMGHFVPENGTSS